MENVIVIEDYQDNWKKVAHCLWLGAKVFGSGKYAVVSHEFRNEVYLFRKRSDAEEYRESIWAHSVYNLEPLLRHRCAAITAKGKQCKRFASHTKEECWQHRRMKLGGPLAA